jgi:hypothetical protein
MFVTLAGMAMEVSELAKANAAFSMEVSWLLSRTLTEVRELAP